MEQESYLTQDRSPGASRSPGLRAKIMTIVVGTVLLLGAAVIAEVRGTFVHTLEAEWDAHGNTLARDVATRAASFVLSDNRPALSQLLAARCDGDEDASYLIVMRPDQSVLADTFSGSIPGGLLEANHADSGEPSVAILETDEGQVRDTAMPILGGRGGFVRVGLSERRLEENVTSLTWRLILVTLLFSAIGVGAVLVFTNRIIHPLEELVAAARAISRGEGGHRASVTTRDEVGRLASAFNIMAESVESASGENGRLLQELRATEAMRLRLLEQVIRAQEDERRRVARELHDETGQSLTSVLIGLRVLQERVQKCGDCSESDGIRANVESARSVAAQTLDEVRRLARDLRPAVLDDMGLPAALERCAREFTRMCAIAVDFHVVGLKDVRLHPAVETALYRIVQEALTNAARHSGARTVNLALERHDPDLHIIVEDDGNGFDPQAVQSAPGQAGLGLFGMRERAGMIGGTLTVESMPGYGATVFVRVPLAGCVRGEEHEEDPHPVGG